MITPAQRTHRLWILVTMSVLLRLPLSLSIDAQTATPPAGFTSLFNGKDLAGWRGGDTYDHRKLLALPASERDALIAKWTASMRDHWRAENGELVNDGDGAYVGESKSVEQLRGVFAADGSTVISSRIHTRSRVGEEDCIYRMVLRIVDYEVTVDHTRSTCTGPV